MAPKDHPLNLNSTMQDNLHDESEETVSLCDLPVYGYDSNYTTTDSEDSMKGDESFEFFSEEWLKTDKDLNFFPNKDTIFGGNLILPKQPISRNTQESKKHDYGTNKINSNSTSGRDREFAKFMSMNKGRNHGAGEHETRRVFPASSSQKSRWYYYGFGLAGIPAEMDLSAIKNRQNRHRRNHSAGGGKPSESGGFRHGKGLSRLIRDLSCDGQTQANSMVKASLVCIPRV